MRRSLHSNKPGQSLPLLAMMLVVIIGMVGLSVDVGNAHGQQRRVQNASNAGAMVALNTILSGQTNQGVWNNVKSTLAGNHVPTTSAAYTYRADYIMRSGTITQLGCWNGTAEVCASGNALIQTQPNAIPNVADIERVRVTVTERVDTYFARVVGRPDLTVSADGAACKGYFAQGTYPLGVPYYLREKDTSHPGIEWHKIYTWRTPNNAGSFGASPPNGTNSNGTLRYEAAQGSNNQWWGKWADPRMIGKVIYFPTENRLEAGMSGTHIPWLSWSSANSSNAELTTSFTYPGNLQDGFTEATPPAGKSNGPTPNFMEPMDWISGDTGVRSSLMNNPDTSPFGLLRGDDRELILPLYDEGVGNGSNGKFHIYTFKKFKLWDWDHSANGYIMLQYLGDASNGSVIPCAAD